MTDHPSHAGAPPASSRPDPASPAAAHPDRGRPRRLGRGVRRITAVALWAAAVGAYLAWSLNAGLDPLSTTPLRLLLERIGGTPWGPLLFVGLYALRPLALLSAALLSVAAGALFGPVWGVVWTVLGANLGAALAYALGRILGADAVAASLPARLAAWPPRLRRATFRNVVLMRLLFLPYDLVSYLGGALRLPFGAFVLATALGSLPGTVAFTLAGAASGDLREPALEPATLVASALIFISSLALSRVLRRREPGPDHA